MANHTGYAMNEQVKFLSQQIKEKGSRLTSARQTIIEKLVECGGHVSADELVELIRRESPGIGRMTVYRTLDLLHELGLIRPTYQGTGAAHYILLHQGHHHHFVCTSCDLIIEFDDCLVTEAAQTLERQFQFQIQSHLVELHGLCQECQN